MTGAAVAVMAGLVLAYSLVARRLALANLTAPILSLLAGVAVFSISPTDVDTSSVHFTAELYPEIPSFRQWGTTVRLLNLNPAP